MRTPGPKLWVLLLLLAITSSVHPDSIVEGDALKLIARVDHLDGLAREPMVAQHPGGAVFVSGFGSQVRATDWTVPPPLWRSDDEGQTWARVAVGTSEQGAQGNSDVDLIVGADGTIYLLAMGFNRTTGKGTHIAIGVSHNVGTTWQWNQLSASPMDDRPWVAASPSGRVHAIWNNGKGVHHSVSDNAGRSWKEQDKISKAGGSSHLAIGPGGEIAVRITPLSASGNQFDPDVNHVAISTDAGRTWQASPAPGNAVWSPDAGESIPRWVEPVAWGTEQTLYALWSEGNGMTLGWSTDLGTSWQTTVIAEEPGLAFFPYLISNHRGELAATWFVRDGASLTARLAHIDVRSSNPVVRRAAPFVPLSWTEAEHQQPHPGGEYVPVLFMDKNRLAVVTPVQDLRNDRWGFTWWMFSY